MKNNNFHWKNREGINHIQLYEKYLKPTMSTNYRFPKNKHTPHKMAPIKQTYILAIPENNGLLLTAAEKIHQHNGNIARIHYDNRVDHKTVFATVLAEPEDQTAIEQDLRTLGYLLTELNPPKQLKLAIYLNDTPGELHRLLTLLKPVGVDITMMDYDETGTHPETLTLTLETTDQDNILHVLEPLQKQYRLEVLAYDTSDPNLDSSISYIRFTDRIRPYLGMTRESDVLAYLADVNAAVQQLTALGKDPRESLQIMENIGIYLTANEGENFTSDYQRIPLSNGRELWVIQLPGGGNINLFTTPEGKMVLDTGYGCCYHDVERMLYALGAGGFENVRRVICTHADADHCGAAGYFPVTPLMHPVTKKILEAGTRGFGSDAKFQLLEKVYTTTINTFSKMYLPEKIDTCKTQARGMYGPFPIVDELEFAGMHFEIWESLGGHIAGQIFLYEPDEGLLFTSDALINFATLSDARKNYCSIADYLVTSVNVNSDIARTERKELLKIAQQLDNDLKQSGKRLYICCGHGAVCTLNTDGRMIPATPELSYTPYKHP